ncbi:MAG: hypothetical protein JHC95_17290 [Solirubrobacteraceae bacterium]|nr:hypothetical protein [Solirubrobacteraceae bacterium]
MSFVVSRRRLAVTLALGAAAGAVCAPAANATTGLQLSTFPAGQFSYLPADATGGFGGASDSRDATGENVRTVQLRGGVEIAAQTRTSQTGGSVSVKSGDVFNVLDTTTGDTILSYTYDGRPSLDATTCVGQTAFSGQRTGDSEIWLQETGSLSEYMKGTYQNGKLGTSGTGTFSGQFPRALTAGRFLLMVQTLRVTDTTGANAWIEIYSSSAVAACPVPPVDAPKPTPAPDTTKPTVGKAVLPKGNALKLANFLIKGFSTTVTINEPGTVTQQLFLNNGAKLTAKTAAKSKKKAKPVLLAKGSTVSKVAGKVKVKIKATKAGKKAIKGKRTVKAILVTTVKDLAGNTSTPSQAKLTLKK